MPENEPMKVYVAMRALPWEKFSIITGEAGPDGQKPAVSAKGDHRNAGFLPVYWTEDAAKEANPGAEIQPAMVPADWHVRPAQPLGDQKRLSIRGDLRAVKDKEILYGLAVKAEEHFTSHFPEGDLLPLREAHLDGKGPTKRMAAKRLRAYIEGIAAATHTD
jgi:hypothetical protein